MSGNEQRNTYSKFIVPEELRGLAPRQPIAAALEARRQAVAEQAKREKERERVFGLYHTPASSTGSFGGLPSVPLSTFFAPSAGAVMRFTPCQPIDPIGSVLIGQNGAHDDEVVGTSMDVGLEDQSLVQHALEEVGTQFADTKPSEIQFDPSEYFAPPSPR